MLLCARTRRLRHTVPSASAAAARSRRPRSPTTRAGGPRPPAARASRPPLPRLRRPPPCLRLLCAATRALRQRRACARPGARLRPGRSGGALPSSATHKGACCVTRLVVERTDRTGEHGRAWAVLEGVTPWGPARLSAGPGLR